MRPYSQEPALADVNGCAGCLEMCLGHDMLTIDRELAPVQRKSYHSALKRYHGTRHRASPRAPLHKITWPGFGSIENHQQRQAVSEPAARLAARLAARQIFAGHRRRASSQGGLSGSRQGRGGLEGFPVLPRSRLVGRSWPAVSSATVSGPDRTLAAGVSGAMNALTRALPVCSLRSGPAPFPAARFAVRGGRR